MIPFTAKADAENGRREIRQYRIAPSVRASVHAGGLVLLHTATGMVLASNPVGGRIWQGLESGESADRISSGVAREYGVAEATVRSDTARFLEELRAEGILLAPGDGSGAD